jgi:hypothetical protein
LQHRICNGLRKTSRCRAVAEPLQSRCRAVARSLQEYLVAVFDLNEEQ